MAAGSRMNFSLCCRCASKARLILKFKIKLQLWEMEYFTAQIRCSLCVAEETLVGGPCSSDGDLTAARTAGGSPLHRNPPSAYSYAFGLVIPNPSRTRKAAARGECKVMHKSSLDGSLL